MIDKNAQPGRRALRVVTATGATDAPFEITAPLPRAGRFQGFTPDDGIYLIIPVRFADGDSANKKETRACATIRAARAEHGVD